MARHSGSGGFLKLLISYSLLLSSFASANVLRKYEDVMRGKIEKRYGTMSAPASTTWMSPASSSVPLCPNNDGDIYTGMLWMFL
jgi:hypothetical protein